MSFAKSKLESHFGALSAIEFVLLQTIAIHGLVTSRIWKELASLEGLPSQDVSGAMRSLTNRKIVAARTLHHGQNYFAFTKESVLQLGLAYELGDPLSEKSKLRAYARLIFFIRHRPGFVKLTKSELEAKLCQPCHGLPNGFYGDPNNLPFIGFVRVDTHIHSIPERSSQILRSDVHQFVSIKPIAACFKAKQFEFTWVTATQRRADAVMKRFKEYELVGGAPINVVVIPELIPLITSIVM